MNRMHDGSHSGIEIHIENNFIVGIPMDLYNNVKKVIEINWEKK